MLRPREGCGVGRWARAKGRWALAAAGFSLLFLIVFQIGILLSFPDELKVFPGQEVPFYSGPLFSLVALPPGASGTDEVAQESSDDYQVELRFLGWLPLQRALVRVVPPMSVVPGGHAVGILLSSHGLAVVRTTPVMTADGGQRSPAQEAGLAAGDIIVEAGGVAVNHPVELENLAEQYGRQGRALPLVIRRDGEELRLAVKPLLARDPTGRGMRYMLGVYLKDPAAGVGTLTFWDPVSGRYGALGHMIAEGGEAALLVDGRIVPAQIHGINPGERGRPGEKVGIFEPGEPMGTIDKNTPVGIFGRLIHPPRAVADPVPIALSREIKEGKAEILTVIEGGRVESFEVQILAVQRQSRPGGKGLVIRVSDPRLIQRTNGIVQGMSGSPILQDGKLVGAVTHVFINDPLRGFGVLAEWMVYEAGLGGGEEATEGREKDDFDEFSAASARGFFSLIAEGVSGGASSWTV